MQNRNIKPRNRRNWPVLIRRITQAAFFIYILAAAIRHNVGGEALQTASIDALCPFGGLETLWRMIVEGRYIPKTHPSNIVLGIGLLVGTVLAGGAFCGWICPFGTLQDILSGLRKRIRLPELKIPVSLDRWLRYGRFFVLALVLFKTISTVKLWFSGVDPYRTIFSLEWLFDFNWAEHWQAYLIACTILIASFWINRFWCKYLCPLGGALSLVGHLSLLRIRRDQTDCKNCGLCEKPCPVGISVAKANPRVNPNCIGCLDCVEACPRRASLGVYLSPSWWERLTGLVKRSKRSSQESVRSTCE